MNPESPALRNKPQPAKQAAPAMAPIHAPAANAAFPDALPCPVMHLLLGGSLKTGCQSWAEPDAAV